MSVGIREQKTRSSPDPSRRRPASACQVAWLKPWLMVLTLALVFSTGGGALDQSISKSQSIEGKLTSVKGAGPVLKTVTQNYPLSGKTTYLFHTLQDKRLQNREVHLEGVLVTDGTFEVEYIYAVHGGKLYRIRYFCETCNIEALEPGDCVCCQQPTELQEYPASEGTDPNPRDIVVLH